VKLFHQTTALQKEAFNLIKIPLSYIPPATSRMVYTITILV